LELLGTLLPIDHEYPMSAGHRTVSESQRIEFLARLREARALVLRDAESFHEAVTALEHIGQVFAGQIRTGLGSYQKEILALAAEAERFTQEEVTRLFTVVREARNMAVHEGAWVRHLNTRLVDLFLILEEAIMSKMQRVEDLMVRTPVAAEPWHLLGHVRKLMLANSFSNIPVHVESSGTREWRILTDTTIMRWLRGATSKTEETRRLSTPVSDALEKHLIVAEKADCCRSDALVSELLPRMNHLPILVTQLVNGQEQLVGLIMTFDLL